MREVAIDDALSGPLAAAREKLLEALGDFDDHLLEELLEGIEPPLEEVRKDLHDEYARDQIVPVALRLGPCTASASSALIAAIAEQFPSPLDVERHRCGRQDRSSRAADGPLVAQVCKTTTRSQGKLSVVRIFTGTLSPTPALIDTSRDRRQARAGRHLPVAGQEDRNRSPAPGRARSSRSRGWKACRRSTRS